MRNKFLTKPMLLVIIMFFAFNSCGDKTSKSSDAENKSTAQSFDLADAKKAVDDGNLSLMDFLKKGDSTGFTSLYCTDAKIMAPGGPAVVGRDAIRSVIGSFV